jgi:hypothetical protein
MKFEDITEYCNSLRDLYAERDALLDEMDRMYLLDWADKVELTRKFDFMRIVLSPVPRNKIKAALRLLTATDPIISIPKELQQSSGQDVGDKLESMAQVMLRASDRIRGNPCHLDACLSALLYDEIHILINDTSTLAKHARAGGTRKQAERVARLTPYLFEVQNPKGCYAEYSNLGLRAWARCSKMTHGNIVDTYGSKGEAALDSATDSRSRFDEYYVWTYYDLDQYCVYVENCSEPIYLEDHGLPFIPVVTHRVEGSRLFSDVSDQSEPFLMSMYKSGLWNTQNIALSAMATSTAVGLWPTAHYEGPAGTEPELDLSQPFGVIRTDPGTKLEQWSKNLIDPALPQLWQTISSLAESATLYEQVAGQPLGTNSTYSETALLNQAGRLPLTASQRKAGWALGDALRMAFLWMRESKGKYKASDSRKQAEIAAADIPETLEVEVSLDLALPQDRLQMSNIFNTLKGVLPTDWLIENVLNERQPDQLIERAMGEQAFQSLWQAYVQQQVTNVMMQQQQQMQAQQMQAAPQQGQGGMTPELLMQAQQQQGTNPMEGGLPPEMMAGGMQGPGEMRAEQQMMPPGMGGG